MVEVKLYFNSPIERNKFAAEALHKAEIKDIRMGHDYHEIKGYWISYKEDKHES